jgi:hypothetical protein
MRYEIITLDSITEESHGRRSVKEVAINQTTRFHIPEEWNLN